MRPPHPPELPEAARPRWAPGFGFAAMAAGTGVVIAASMALVPVALASGVEGSVGAAALLVLILVQDAGYVGAALFFANLRGGRPRLWHFGLRATPVKRTLIVTAVATAVILGFELGFSELAGIDEGGADELASGDGLLAALALSLTTIVVAPVAEEFFFRGFVYRALRTRLAVWSSTLTIAAIFASLHVQYLGQPWIFVIIGVFAVGTCLVYEATGNLFTVIAIHAIFNTLATAGTDAGYLVPIAVGVTMVAGCLLVPGKLGPAPSPFARTRLAQ